MKLRLVLVAVLFLFACGKSDPIIGEWVQPIPGMDDQMQGINLEEGGKASSINMNTLVYEKWQQDGDKLILSGKSIGNGQTIEFNQEYTLSTACKDRLILTSGKIKLVYERAK